MSTEKFLELERISQAVGQRIDYVQGGGGNTSVKLDDSLMAVKASGCKLKDMTSTEGFVVINYKNIREYYERIDIHEDRDYEKESGEFVRANIVPVEGIKSMRPSVEAGFHSVLLRYVIHTHSVYANIICCSQEGRSLAQEIFRDKEYGFLWIPYINPGFSLTMAIKDKVSEYIRRKGRFPQVIFMENHGLVVTADKEAECVELHEEVNETIRRHFGIESPFPEVSLYQSDENTLLSGTAYLKEYFKSRDLPASFFNDTSLYPDQLVYLYDSISFNGLDNKINIDTNTGEIRYKTGVGEARTMEETLTGVVYVIEQIQKNKLHLKTMTKEDIGFIKNWESEKYRKNLSGGVKGTGV